MRFMAEIVFKFDFTVSTEDKGATRVHIFDLIYYSHSLISYGELQDIQKREETGTHLLIFCLEISLEGSNFI